MENMNRILILKRFKEIGLSSYEAKSYLSLLQRDTLTVSEISRLSGIPRANAYEALEKLMSKGMCIAKPGDTKKYSASDPLMLQEKFLAAANSAAEIELENLGKKHKETLEKSKAALEAELKNLNEKEREILERAKVVKENITAVINQLRPQYEKSRLETSPMDYIEVIKDPYQIHRRFMQLCAQAREEILMFTKPPFTGPREKLEEQVDQESGILKRGIRGRSIYEIAKDEDEERWQREMIDRAVRSGEEARVIEELPMKMGIFDERIVMLFLEDPVSGQISLTAQVVEHRSLAKSLKITFKTLWEQAKDYHALKG
jgi:sugar-specific transcriptional regulator TrmB